MDAAADYFYNCDDQRRLTSMPPVNQMHNNQQLSVMTAIKKICHTIKNLDPHPSDESRYKKFKNATDDLRAIYHFQEIKNPHAINQEKSVHFIEKPNHMNSKIAQALARWSGNKK